MQTKTTIPYEIKPISGFLGYFVDTEGVVWSTRKRGMSGAMFKMKPTAGVRGHLRVVLHQGGRKFPKLVHTLVLETFVGPRPDPKWQGCHYPDKDPSNNRLENLRWDTVSNNHLDIGRKDREAGVKVCPKCGERKPLDGFYKRKNGLARSECKSCEIARVHKWQDENPEKKRQIQREWDIENVGRKRELRRKHYRQNAQRINAERKEKRQRSAEVEREKAREYYQKNKARIRAYQNERFRAKKAG